LCYLKKRIRDFSEPVYLINISRRAKTLQGRIDWIARERVSGENRVLEKKEARRE
jgi:hypothetical protein